MYALFYINLDNNDPHQLLGVSRRKASLKKLSKGHLNEVSGDEFVVTWEVDEGEPIGRISADGEAFGDYYHIVTVKEV